MSVENSGFKYRINPFSKTAREEFKTLRPQHRKWAIITAIAVSILAPLVFPTLLAFRAVVIHLSKGDKNQQAKVHEQGSKVILGDQPKTTTKPTMDELYKLANEGNVNACVMLGQHYKKLAKPENRIVNIQFANEAYGFYAKAFKLNAQNADAQLGMGQCLRDGIGIEKNAEKAFEYFQLAAEQGNTEAMRELGFCYLAGSGTKKDMNEAINQFRRAHQNGNEEAKKDLEALLVTQASNQPVSSPPAPSSSAPSSPQAPLAPPTPTPPPPSPPPMDPSASPTDRPEVKKQQVGFTEESPAVFEYEMDPEVQKGKKKGGLTTKHGAIGLSAEEVVKKRMERFKVESPSFENFALKFINLNNSDRPSEEIRAAPDTAKYLGQVMERVFREKKGAEASVLMEAVLEAVINENKYVKRVNFDDYSVSINAKRASSENKPLMKVTHEEKVRLGEDEDPIENYGDWFDHKDEIREVHCMRFLVDEDEGIDELESLRSVLEALFKDDEFLNWVKT